jgi:hypothetical protein
MFQPSDVPAVRTQRRQQVEIAHQWMPCQGHSERKDQCEAEAAIELPSSHDG